MGDCYFMNFLFAAGFAHKENPQSIDLNCIRLCYQVFLEGTDKGAFTFALKPVVSDPIFDKSKLLQKLPISKVLRTCILIYNYIFLNFRG